MSDVVKKYAKAYGIDVIALAVLIVSCVTVVAQDLKETKANTASIIEMKEDRTKITNLLLTLKVNQEWIINDLKGKK